MGGIFLSGIYFFILLIPSGINIVIFFFYWNRYNVILVPVGTNAKLWQKFYIITEYVATIRFNSALNSVAEIIDILNCIPISEN